MAKFCGNCGAKLEDSAKVCGKCGTPLEGQSTQTAGLKVTDSERQQKLKKRIKLVISMAALVAVAVIVFNIVLNFTGNKGLLRKVMTAYENYDINTLISLSSDMYYYVPEDYTGQYEEFDAESGMYMYYDYGAEDYVEQYFENKVGDDLDSFETSVGHSYKLSYEVNEIYELSERKLKDVLEDIENMCPDFDVSLIEKVAVADLTVTAKQGSKSVNRDLKITMSKEDGTWKLLYIE